MKTYKVTLSKDSAKALKKLPKKTNIKVIALLKKLQREPKMGKQLKGKLTGIYSIRVWPYRILYEIYEKELIILVIKIAHRQGVYSKQ